MKTVRNYKHIDLQSNCVEFFFPFGIALTIACRTLCASNPFDRKQDQKFEVGMDVWMGKRKLTIVL
jgi:hypothetical protein